jgi:hypothetical protein
MNGARSGGRSPRCSPRSQIGQARCGLGAYQLFLGVAVAVLAALVTLLQPFERWAPTTSERRAGGS